MEHKNETFSTLYEKTYNDIMQCLKTGKYVKNGKLFPESELAEILGVSRTVIRDVLAQFESKGYVSRRRGIGTTVNPKVVELRARIDIQNELTDFVKNNGYECEVVNVNIFYRSADAKLSMLLQMPLGSEVIVIERTYKANGIPAIYEVDYVSKKTIGEIKSEELLRQSTHKYIDEHTDFVLDTDITNFEPMISNKLLASQIGTKRNQLMLQTKEQYFDLYQIPYVYSEKYYVNDLFKFNVIRKKA